MRDLDIDMSEWKSGVGERLRASIKNRLGKRKEFEFAEALDMSQGSLSEILNGVTSPSAQTLHKITLRTTIDIRWLLTGIKRK